MSTSSLDSSFYNLTNNNKNMKEEQKRKNNY